MIYLDNSATGKPLKAVVDAYTLALEEDYFNISSPYSNALSTEKKMAKAKKIICDAINCKESELIFTSGGTESDNTALNLAKDNSEIIVSCYEHHAVLNYAESLKKRNIKVILCPVNKSGVVEKETLENLVNENTSLVSIMHVNNEIGAINDIKMLCSAVKEKNPNTMFHSDGVQAFMHICADIKELGVDLYSISAHKIHGPKGIGALYIKKGVPFTPFISGGGQQENKRSGTVNVPSIIAFSQAVSQLKNGFSQNIKEIKDRYISLLSKISDVKFICPDSAPNILSVAFLGVKASSLQNALENDVIIGKGSACTSRSSKVSHVLEAIGLPLNIAESTIRISFGAFNTIEEADQAVEKIEYYVNYLRKYKRK
ncbi:MAG: cysteine desulfurase [Clostridiales bacterium]|nr:cysteine desulfurase [Clostridiales bacterium]